MKFNWKKIILVGGFVVLAFSFSVGSVSAADSEGEGFAEMDVTKVNSMSEALEKASGMGVTLTRVTVQVDGKRYENIAVEYNLGAGKWLLAHPDIKPRTIQVKDGNEYRYVVVEGSEEVKTLRFATDSESKAIEIANAGENAANWAAGSSIEAAEASSLNPLWSLKKVMSGLLAFIQLVVAFFGMVFMFIFDIFVNVGAGQFLAWKGVQGAWSAIRDLCNMLFILVLLAIAFMTVFLGTEGSSYSVKRALPLLIVAVLTINFSFFMCRAIIEGGDIVTNFFAGRGLQAGIIGDIMGYKKFSEIKGPADSTTGSSTEAGTNTSDTSNGATTGAN